MKKLTDDQILAMIGRVRKHVDYNILNKFYKGKKVLVTGGAGSIGSELVKLLLELETKQVIAFDFNEFAIFRLPEHPKLVKKIGDVKTRALFNVLKVFGPDVVVHASAYKHVPLMQSNPLEAFNNNVFGCSNTIELCSRFGVESFVLVSTDKAVKTTNVMGATKRLCEILLENSDSDMTLNAVRFGNVIRSRGSAINTFISQIENGEDVTVTHSKVKRYFMSKQEAVELILQSAIETVNKSIYLLDMGMPIKIVDLAQALIKELGSNSKIKFIGLRNGEKMFEELTFDPTSMVNVGNMYRITNVDRQKVTFKRTLKLFEKSLKYQFSDSEIKTQLIKLGFDIRC